jgi:hypothetical protein
MGVGMTKGVGGCTSPCPGPLAHTSGRRRPETPITPATSGVGFPEGADFRHTHSLGLQSVYLLTEQLGAMITLERIGGTTFTLTLPFDPSQGQGKHRGQSAGPDR